MVSITNAAAGNGPRARLTASDLEALRSLAHGVKDSPAMFGASAVAVAARRPILPSHMTLI